MCILNFPTKTVPNTRSNHELIKKERFTLGHFWTGNQLENAMCLPKKNYVI
jgi:hypothetical protein